MLASRTVLGAPWYRQFWPWFLIALPALSVIGGVSALVIAVRNADSVVADDWYKRGLAINLDLERERVAADLGIAAAISVDPDAHAVRITLEGGGTDSEDSLTLALSHPTQQRRDTALRLVRGPDGVFLGSTTAELHGRWYASLVPDHGAWRLAGALVLAPGEHNRLVPRT